ncbi:WHG domain-containing protein [Bacillus sp. JJ1122]|uniref:TetR/AcrR family transcriptional regulator n=1 Tax=Bacillus sp. JJ1122 TaxID=3122951 RepID=UPI002FFF01C8
MSPRPKVALDKTEIIMAAAELANEFGSENVTLALLAKKLRIKPPSLYNHFEGLPGIKRELAIFSLEKLYRGLATAAAGKHPGEEAVLAISESYLSFARKNPGLYESALAAPDPADTEVYYAGKKIVDLVVSTIEPFKLKEDSAIHTVRGLRSIMHGFASLEQKGGFGLSLDLDESYKEAVKAFLTGLKG